MQYEVRSDSYNLLSRWYIHIVVGLVPRYYLDVYTYRKNASSAGSSGIASDHYMYWSSNIPLVSELYRQRLSVSAESLVLMSKLTMRRKHGLQRRLATPTNPIKVVQTGVLSTIPRSWSLPGSIRGLLPADGTTLHVLVWARQLLRPCPPLDRASITEF